MHLSTPEKLVSQRRSRESTFTIDSSGVTHLPRLPDRKDGSTLHGLYRVIGRIFVCRQFNHGNWAYRILQKGRYPFGWIMSLLEPELTSPIIASFIISSLCDFMEFHPCRVRTYFLMDMLPTFYPYRINGNRKKDSFLYQVWLRVRDFSSAHFLR